MRRVEAAPGLVIERHLEPRAPTAKVGDRIITIVRVDPERRQVCEQIHHKIKHHAAQP